MDKPHPLRVATGRFGLGLRLSTAASTQDPRADVEASLASLSLPVAALMDSAGQLKTVIERHAQRVAVLKQTVAASRQGGAAGMEEMGAMSMGGMSMGAMQDAPASAANRSPDTLRMVSRGEELDAWLTGAIDSPSPLQERLALYWGNHFTTSAVKGKVGVTVAAYQREAIRPRILGTFHDLLVATVTHPAMLFYLDNDVSVGPNSFVGRHRKSGLNENLAREVLELHTLGTGGGYTQADVTAFAAVLTGWRVDLDTKSDLCGQTIFDPRRHEPGPIRVLGKTYPDTGKDQLLAVLRDLAASPQTAKHVARRFAAAFVSDAPPPALVARLERSFLSTGGDLRDLALTLVRSDEAWSMPLNKLRPPIEFMVATARLVGALPRPPRADIALVAMGQPFLIAPSPKGWPEDDNGWATSDGIKTRLDWSQNVAARHAQNLDMKALVNDAMKPLLSDETRTAVLRAESREQALTLLLMSPDFQRR